MNRPEIFEAVREAFDRGRWVLMTNADGSPREITLDLAERDDDLFDHHTGPVDMDSPPNPEPIVFRSHGGISFDAVVGGAPVDHTVGWVTDHWAKVSPQGPVFINPPFHSDDHGPAIPAQAPCGGKVPGPIIYEFALQDVGRSDIRINSDRWWISICPDPAAAEAADWVHVYDRVTRERRTLKRPEPDAVLTGLRDVAADLRRGPGTPKPYVGQQITVTDYHGVKGPGVVTQASADGFKVDVQFRHTDSSPDTADRYEWFFAHGETNDYGLTLDFVPFQSERGAPVEPPFGCAALPPIGPLTSTEGLKVGDIVRILDGYPTLGETGALVRVAKITPDKWVGVAHHNAGDPSWKADRFAFVGRPDADGWMTWAGGENPVPGARVAYRVGDDPDDDRTADSDLLDWSAAPPFPKAAIVAFRIVDTPSAV